MWEIIRIDWIFFEILRILASRELARFLSTCDMSMVFKFSTICEFTLRVVRNERGLGWGFTLRFRRIDEAATITYGYDYYYFRTESDTCPLRPLVVRVRV